MRQSARLKSIPPGSAKGSGRRFRIRAARGSASAANEAWGKKTHS